MLVLQDLLKGIEILIGKLKEFGMPEGICNNIIQYVHKNRKLKL